MLPGQAPPRPGPPPLSQQCLPLAWAPRPQWTRWACLPLMLEQQGSAQQVGFCSRPTMRSLGSVSHLLPGLLLSTCIIHEAITALHATCIHDTPASAHPHCLCVLLQATPPRWIHSHAARQQARCVRCISRKRLPQQRQQQQRPPLRPGPRLLGPAATWPALQRPTVLHRPHPVTSASGSAATHMPLKVRRHRTRSRLQACSVTTAWRTS
jgi:hypothetical protein